MYSALTRSDIFDSLSELSTDTVKVIDFTNSINVFDFVYKKSVNSFKYKCI